MCVSRVHVLNIEPNRCYRNAPDGPVYRAVGGPKEPRRALCPDGSIVRVIDTPDYTLYVIPCDERGNPR